MAAADVAEVAAARRKVKQAGELCRKASQRLAEADSLDVYAIQHIAGPADAARAGELIALALGEHDHVDVVVLTTRRPHHQ